MHVRVTIGGLFMNKLINITLICFFTLCMYCILILPCVNAQSTQVFDVRANFPHVASGENGVYVQILSNGGYSDLPNVADSYFEIWDNGFPVPQIAGYTYYSSTPSPNTILAHPSAITQCGLEADAIIRVTIPGIGGQVRVTGNGGMESGGSVRFYIYKGADQYNNPIWEAWNGGSFDFTIPYTSGEQIFFATDAGPDDYSDWAEWTDLILTIEPTSTPTPTPTPIPPVASFTYTPSNPTVKDVITFDATSSTDSDGTISNYQWDFGDNTNGNGAIVTHTFAKPGTYNVGLTVTDNDGLTNTVSQTIQILKQIPTVQITGDNTLLVSNMYNSKKSSPTITLKAKVKPSGGTYQWEVVNGQDKVNIIGSTTSSKITVQGISPSGNPNDVTIKVAYTVNGQTVTTTTDLTVLRAADISVTAGFPKIKKWTNVFGNLYDYKMTYNYQVIDQFGSPIHVNGLDVTEDWQLVSTNYPKFWVGDTFYTTSIKTVTYNGNKGTFYDELKPALNLPQRLHGSIPQDLHTRILQRIIVDGWEVQTGYLDYYYDHALCTPIS
jgi:PKD repeat protein